MTMCHFALNSVRPVWPVEFAAHGLVLTPGRYVGAGAAEEDDEPFEEKFDRLMGELRGHFAEGRRLEDEIAARLGGLV